MANLLTRFRQLAWALPLLLELALNASGVVTPKWSLVLWLAFAMLAGWATWPVARSFRAKYPKPFTYAATLIAGILIVSAYLLGRYHEREAADPKAQLRTLYTRCVALTNRKVATEAELNGLRRDAQNVIGAASYFVREGMGIAAYARLENLDVRGVRSSGTDNLEGKAQILNVGIQLYCQNLQNLIEQYDQWKQEGAASE